MRIARSRRGLRRLPSAQQREEDAERDGDNQRKAAKRPWSVRCAHGFPS
jgi:hypothetical protein